MNKDVIAWITKITQEYALCGTCGRPCHICLTIAEYGVKFYAYCPDCDRKHNVFVSMRILKECGQDLTDTAINKLKKAFGGETAE